MNAQLDEGSNKGVFEMKLDTNSGAYKKLEQTHSQVLRDLGKAREEYAKAERSMYEVGHRILALEHAFRRSGDALIKATHGEKIHPAHKRRYKNYEETELRKKGCSGPRRSSY